MVDVIKEIDDTLALLHEFYVKKFTNDDDTDLNEHWNQTILKKTDRLYDAVTDEENRYYKMRNWLPRWLINRLSQLEWHE